MSEYHVITLPADCANSYPLVPCEFLWDLQSLKNTVLQKFYEDEARLAVKSYWFSVQNYFYSNLMVSRHSTSVTKQLNIKEIFRGFCNVIV